MPFENFEAYNAYKDQIQTKYDGDAVVFTENLIEFDYSPLEKVNRSENGKGCDYL